MTVGIVVCRTVADGGNPARECILAEETPIAISYCGVPYAVMMATSEDLEDFALGFSVTEEVAAGVADLSGMSVRRVAEGIELDVKLVPDAFRRFLARRRVRVLRGRTSCGLCGVEDLAAVGRVKADLSAASPISPEALLRTAQDLRSQQRLGQATACTHAAVWAMPDGRIVLVREDVGRHNALDKLIGAVLREGQDRRAGFCLVTSRCSFELVQKAARADLPSLVALGAPTGLAVRLAQEAGLTLVARGVLGLEVFAAPGAGKV